MKHHLDTIHVGGIVCYSYKEVAKQLHIHSQTVSKMVSRGDLKSIRVGRFKYVPFPSLKEYGKGNK